MRRVVLLWEDSIGGGQVVREFGPGSLVRACVADDLGVSIYADEVKLGIVHHPMNGNQKVVHGCRAKEYVNSSATVMAVLDLDRAYQVCELPADACLVSIRNALRERTGPAVVRLIDRNIESVFTTARVVLGEPTTVIRKPRLQERDRVLNALAFGRERAEARSELRSRVPSFDRLVRAVRCALEPRPA
ncbi:MAG: hypothetical protein HMLKMBBP_00273 [Planctomycetes bacterium]|nr:hypothetical protein [Planctomycetota bacterium]